MRYLLAVLLFIASSAYAQDEPLQISPNDCQMAGRAMGAMTAAAISGVPASRLLPAVRENYIPKFGDMPREVQEMLQFMALVAAQSAEQMTPERNADGFTRLCYSLDGDVAKITKYFKSYLGLKETEI